MVDTLRLIPRSEWHRSITDDDILEAAKNEMFGLENPGFCILCGNQQDGCEPDARHYRCEECGLRGVYSAAELMLYIS